jgi:hypothetical protein
MASLLQRHFISILSGYVLIRDIILSRDIILIRIDDGIYQSG